MEAAGPSEIFLPIYQRDDVIPQKVMMVTQDPQEVKVKVKQSYYRPGVAQMFPGS